jgi:hypothetical protein
MRSNAFSKAALIVLAGLEMLLGGCPSPSGGYVEKYGTVGARIYDSVTGEPISGAKVAMDYLNATTDATGACSFDWGNDYYAYGLAVWKDLSYSFVVYDNATIDASTHPVYRVALDPFDTSAYPTYTLSGTLPTAVSGGGGILIRVRNSDGGASESGVVNLSDGATSYSASVKTGGINCCVVVYYDDNFSDSNLPILQYYTNQNLAVGPNTLDIGAVSDSVTVYGTPGDEFSAEAFIPAYGYIPLVPGFELSGSSVVVPFSNTAGYPLIWTVSQSETKAGVGDFYRLATSASTPQASTVTLPTAPNSANDPKYGGGKVYWDAPSACLFHAPVGGANVYGVMLTDNAGHKGTVASNRTLVILGNTLPEASMLLTNDVLLPGAGWDAQLIPEWASITDPVAYIGHNGITGIQSLQIIGVMNGPDATTVDAIP